MTDVKEIRMADFKDIIGALAPTVASALLGPLGGLAVSAIGNIMGVSNATQDKISKAITSGQMTPEQVAKLRELEITYQNEEKERNFKYAELEFKDRDSARSRDTEIVKATGHNRRADILAYGALLAFTLATVALFRLDIPQDNRELIVYLLGALTVIVKDIYGFEFGSSKSSQNKDDTIKKLSE